MILPFAHWWSDFRVQRPEPRSSDLNFTTSSMTDASSASMNTNRPRFGALSNSSEAMSRPELARSIPQPGVRTPQFALPIPQVGISRGSETIPRAVETSRRRRLPSGAERSTLRPSIFHSPRHRKSSRQRRSGSRQRRLQSRGPKTRLASRFFYLDGTGSWLDSAGYGLAIAGNHLANAGSIFATTR